ncbi:unnamed protein product, partial [Closterium sp. NIES-54]
RAAPPPPNRTALPSSTALQCPAVIVYTAATTATAATLATAPTAAMASPTVLTFEAILAAMYALADSEADLQDAWVDQFTPGGQRVTHCTCSRTGRHLATFTRRPGT